MKWITRERVKVDRVACPWLIKKFVDPDAEFLFVPGDSVLETAEREGAIPYDVPGVELGHHGKECSFESIVRKYNLGGDLGLAYLARIVNGAVPTTPSTTNRKDRGCKRSLKVSGIWASKTITQSSGRSSSSMMPCMNMRRERPSLFEWNQRRSESFRVSRRCSRKRFMLPGFQCSKRSCNAVAQSA
jgi:hypothetical protein